MYVGGKSSAESSLHIKNNTFHKLEVIEPYVRIVNSNYFLREFDGNLFCSKNNTYNTEEKIMINEDQVYLRGYFAALWLDTMFYNETFNGMLW